MKCDLCDYPRFSSPTTEEDVLTKSKNRIREYKKWLDMKNRCRNRNHYQQKGIQIHPHWDSDFVQFFRDCGPQPGPDYVLDRYPDGAGNYEPGNTRWATPRQSNENRTWAVKEPALLLQ
ncbi:hypothetical protein [Gemmata massiliana]|uniref:hypothetical protein n=1 Tax=Gemmata massiliana TaxID=1210884 RepID=UPI001E590161|nr:hypothetical protein [Gemmata massiliana]